MKLRSKILIILMTLFTGLATVPIAWALLDQQVVEQTNASYNDAELKSFADALLDVQRIINSYQPYFESATSTEDENQIVQSAAAEAVQAIVDKGLDVDEFNQILSVAQTDPQLADRIRQHLDEEWI